MLDDWQIWCIEGILSEDETLAMCVTIALLIIPRQNGKNVVLEVIELYLFYVLDWPVLHTAHRQDTSADHMSRLKRVIREHPDLEAITEFYDANGKERIHRKDLDPTTGQPYDIDIRFVTRSGKLGRGKSPRVVVFDEALFLEDMHMAAIVPSMSAQSMNEDVPLLIFTSSAPLPESQVLRRIRKMVFTDRAAETWGAEWSCELGVSADDHAAMFSCNPGMGIRIAMQWVYETERPLLSEDAFLIERFGAVPDEDGEDATEMPNWPLCADTDSSFEDGEHPQFCVDVSVDGKKVAFVAACEIDDKVHVEMISYTNGTVGVADKIARNTRKVWVDPRSEAAGLIQELEKAGVDVQEIGALDYLQACTQFRQGVTNLTIVHRDETPLNQAVAGAAMRTVGDGKVWARRTSSVEISPLVAGTIAAWAVGIPIESEEGDSNLW